MAFDPSKKHGERELDLNRHPTGTTYYAWHFNEPTAIPDGHAHCEECGVWIDTEYRYCLRCCGRTFRDPNRWGTVPGE